MAGDYIKCPRCELNYIKKSDEYCDVCKAELGMGVKLVFAVDEEEELDEVKELCPICKKNYIKFDEDMCQECKDEIEYNKQKDDPEKDESWRDFLDEDKDIPPVEDEEELISLSKLEEDEAKELFGDDEEEEDDEYVEKDDGDDFEEVNPDEVEDIDDEDEELDDDDNDDLD